jgi:hypothetical protein
MTVEALSIGCAAPAALAHNWLTTPGVLAKMVNRHACPGSQRPAIAALQFASTVSISKVGIDGARIDSP